MFVFCLKLTSPFHFYFFTALFSNGRIVCFGANNVGCLGVNSTQTMSTLGGITSLGFITFSDTIPAIQMSQSSVSRDSCVLFANGRVRCWGANSNQQLGDATSLSRGTNTSANSMSTATFVSFKASINAIPIVTVALGWYDELSLKTYIYIYIYIY